MKNFQLRLAEGAYRVVKEVAAVRRISIADVIREALEIYAIGVAYAQEGKRLVWEDPATGEKIQILIPGFSERSLLASLGVRKSDGKASHRRRGG